MNEMFTAMFAATVPVPTVLILFLGLLVFFAVKAK